MNPDVPSSLRLKVITPKKILADETVQEVSLPSLEGYLGILPGHRHLLVALGRGNITWTRAQKEVSYAVRGGYARILPDSVIVFTDNESMQPNEGRG
jgi:F-type H+-transporting ATPase subunit epsilon